MFKYFKDLENAPFHGVAKFATDVVTVEIDSHVLRGSTIDLDWVFQLHDLCEIIQIVCAGVFDTKILNN